MNVLRTTLCLWPIKGLAQCAGTPRGNARTGRVNVRVGRDQTFSFPGRRHLEVQCSAGCAWITQAGDRRDIVLSRGERIGLEGRGRVVVFAFEDSVLRITS